MGNLAWLNWLQKQFDKSIPMFEALLPLQTRNLGRDHPHTKTSVGNLGMNYKDVGRLEEAIPLLEEGYEGSRTDASLRWVAELLLDAYLKAGRVAERDELVKQVVADARELLPEGSPELAGTMARLGAVLLGGEAFAEAEPLLRESLAIREKAQPDEWTTFNTKSLLGGALLGQAKYAEAEPLLLSGYEGLNAREAAIPKTGGGDLRIPEALDRLIELHTATARPDEAEKWRAERAKYPGAKAKGEK